MKKTSSEVIYPIRAAARLTRLSIDTLRAWERRHAVVQPRRKNGIRMYTPEDIQRLSLLRQALDLGYSIGHASQLSNAELLRLLAPADSSRFEADGEEPVRTILSAVEHFDYLAADRELGRLASLRPPHDLIHKVCLPLMRVAGERWYEQRIRIAHEHVLTQLLSNLLGGMIRIYAHEKPSAVMLTATLSDDLHEFGILAAAILAAGAGLGVVHLGASLPPKEISFAARRSGADVVLLSLTHPADPVLREAQLRTVRASLPEEVEIWLGVNPAKLEFQIKGVRLLRDFADLERELARFGGRF